jgi:signal transduction histidine kinase
MRQARERRLLAPAWRAGAEALGIVLAGGFVLAALQTVVPVLLLWQMLFILVGPAALLRFAWRWRGRAGGRRHIGRRALVELGTLAGWNLILLIALFICAGLIGSHSAVKVTPAQGRALFDSTYLASLALFGLMRAGVYVWGWWDALRRRYLLWSLTHGLLAVVAGGAAAFFALSLIVGLLFQPAFILKLLPDAVYLLGTTAVVVVILLPPFALASYLVVRRTTARLAALTGAADALRQGKLAQRVPVTGTDEVAQLQVHFNAMAADLERAQTELRAERDTVAALLRARRELVAAVSHDLRTPVAIMRAYLETLLARWQVQPQADTHHDLAVAHQEIIHLQGLVDDLFALARAEVGKLPLRIQPLDLAAVIARVVDAAAPHAWQAGRVTVAAQPAPDLPSALADERRMEQILHNLVQNAVRHTPPGGLVAVSAARASGQIAVQVRDTGSGIPPADLPHIFERYFQARGNAPHAASGAGLGLALVREWVHAMGGSVRVESRIGVGSCFTVCVPAQG